jgi:hypothetical protein
MVPFPVQRNPQSKHQLALPESEACVGPIRPPPGVPKFKAGELLLLLANIAFSASLTCTPPRSAEASATLRLVFVQPSFEGRCIARRFSC